MAENVQIYILHLYSIFQFSPMTEYQVIIQQKHLADIMQQPTIRYIMYH